ncbi:hypothetical protein H5410_029821 [Solanum commersonii]|uniref:Uncharacterized protein n=1 Tax=Solanum commersonii TaxID=4109 RepID=A0A9J5YCJ6_SOLCO|nr:hypothetical protein H5410_029821 [Solanum commersonii]
MIKQRGRIEGSFVQGHIGRETGDFYSYYLGDEVSCRRNRPNRNDESDIDPLFSLISIFNQNNQGSKKYEKRGFTDRHHEYLGVSQTKQAKKKKSSRPIYSEDIAGSISSVPERISYDIHILAVLFGTLSPTCASPQLSTMRIRDSSSEQSDAMAGTPPLT